MSTAYLYPHALAIMNPAFAHADSSSLAGPSEAGPSYTRTSPQHAQQSHRLYQQQQQQHQLLQQQQQQEQYLSQPTQTQTYAAPEWDYCYEPAASGVSPSGSSVSTPVNDAASSYPHIAGAEPYQAEPLAYPAYEQWSYDAPPTQPAKSSLHGAVGDAYTSHAAPMTAFDAGSMQSVHPVYSASGQAHLYYHPQPQPHAYQSAHQVPETFTEQRTVTVSYTVNVTTTRPSYPAQPQPQLTHTQAYEHVHAPPHQHQPQSLVYEQHQSHPARALHAHSYQHQQPCQHPHQHHQYHQQQQQTYLPSHVPHHHQQQQQQQHIPAHQQQPLLQQQQPQYQYSQSYVPPPPVQSQAPTLFQPKPVHPLPEWTQEPSAVRADEPQWSGARIEEVPSDGDGDDDEMDEDDDDDGEDDDEDEGEEIVEEEGTLPAGSLLCQPIGESVRAQFAQVAVPPGHAPPRPAAQGITYWS